MADKVKVISETAACAPMIERTNVEFREKIDSVRREIHDGGGRCSWIAEQRLLEGIRMTLAEVKTWGRGK